MDFMVCILAEHFPSHEPGLSEGDEVSRLSGSDGCNGIKFSCLKIVSALQLPGVPFPWKGSIQLYHGRELDNSSQVYSWLNWNITHINSIYS